MQQTLGSFRVFFCNLSAGYSTFKVLDYLPTFYQISPFLLLLSFSTASHLLVSTWVNK